MSVLLVKMEKNIASVFPGLEAFGSFSDPKETRVCVAVGG